MEQVSVLDAYKRLHDSKKRGQQSLAEVPMEHLSKAGRGVSCLSSCQKGKLPASEASGPGVDNQAHGQIGAPRFGAQEHLESPLCLRG